MTSPDMVGLVTSSTQNFSSKPPESLIKKNHFSCITRLKIHHQLENHRKKIFFNWTAMGNFLLHNFIWLQFQKEAWSHDNARIEDDAGRCRYLSEETIKKIVGMSKAAWNKNLSWISYHSKHVWTSHRLDSCCENSDFLFRATCIIIKNSFSQKNSSTLKAKIPVRSDLQSDPWSKQSDPGFVDGLDLCLKL